MKFGDLSVEKTWEAFKVLKGKRLTGSFGLLWGVKIPENLADDLPEDKDLPYLEMLYKFVYGKQSYYDLAMTRHVEPKTKYDNDDEAEGDDNEGGGRRRFVGEKRGSGTERRCDARSTVRHVTHRSTNAKTTLASITFYPCSCSAKNPKMGRDYV